MQAHCGALEADDVRRKLLLQIFCYEGVSWLWRGEFWFVITLAIDTCESRGSVALRRDGATVAARRHSEGIDYSAWLLPSVELVLSEAGTRLERVDLFAVATGPGSFTGLRVGLTTVKAWAEVYGKSTVGVSRLEAIAGSSNARLEFTAGSYDASRGQLFGALYRRISGTLSRFGDERVSSPEEFAEWVDREALKKPVCWVSLDPGLLQNLEKLKVRTAGGDTIHTCTAELASVIGALAEERAARGEFSDPLLLDANYVRRSDAEILWKEPAAHVR